jgi:hypothetical protein
MSDLNSIAKTPIRSEFALDADFREVLEAFVEALPERRRLLTELHRDGSLDELGRQEPRCSTPAVRKTPFKSNNASRNCSTFSAESVLSRAVRGLGTRKRAASSEFASNGGKRANFLPCKRLRVQGR